MNFYCIPASDTGNNDSQLPEDITMYDEVPAQNPFVDQPEMDNNSQIGM